LAELLDESHTQIRVVARLYTVADTRDFIIVSLQLHDMRR
jgi:hypothetical protein